MKIILHDAVIVVDLGKVTINAKTAEVVTHESDCVIEPIESIAIKADKVVGEPQKKINIKIPLCSSCNLAHECGNKGLHDCFNYQPVPAAKKEKAAKAPKPKKEKKYTLPKCEAGKCIDCGCDIPVNEKGRKILRCETCNKKKYPWKYKNQ